MVLCILKIIHKSETFFADEIRKMAAKRILEKMFRFYTGAGFSLFLANPVKCSAMIIMLRQNTFLKVDVTGG